MTAIKVYLSMCVILNLAALKFKFEILESMRNISSITVSDHYYVKVLRVVSDRLGDIWPDAEPHVVVRSNKPLNDLHITVSFRATLFIMGQIHVQLPSAVITQVLLEI